MTGGSVKVAFSAPSLLLCCGGGGRLLLLLEGLQHLLLLDGDPLLPALPGLLHLVPAGLGLVGQHLGASLLRLLLVDELHQDALVLEDIPLGLEKHRLKKKKKTILHVRHVTHSQ